MTAVFKGFDPTRSDGGDGYGEGDMRRMFPDVISGAKGLGGRPMSNYSDRTLSNWDPNDVMDDADPGD